MSKISEIIKEQISDCEICDNRKECKECWTLNNAENEIKKLVEGIVPKSAKGKWDWEKAEWWDLCRNIMRKKIAKLFEKSGGKSDKR